MTPESHIGSALRTVFDSSGNLLALIFQENWEFSGVQFVTPDVFQQQVALMNRPAGEVIPSHTHLPVPRSIQGTQEVLIIREGLMRVDLYDEERRLVQSELLSKDSVIVLVSGGHGFEVLESCKFIEVKQGPYVPGKDKEVFTPEKTGSR